MNLPLTLSPLTLLVFFVIGFACICVFSGCLLLFAAKRAPSYYLAFLSFLWAFVEIYSLFDASIDEQTVFQHFNPKLIILAVALGELTLFYLVYLVSPRVATWYGLLCYFGGFVVLILIYGLITLFFPYPIEYESLLSVLSGNINIYSVYLLLLLLYLLFHGWYVVRMIRKFIPLYDRYLDQTYTEVDRRDVSWLHFVVYPIDFIAFLFVLYLFFDEPWISIVYVLMLTLLFGVCLYTSLLKEPIDRLSGDYHLMWSLRQHKWVMRNEVTMDPNQDLSIDLSLSKHLSENQLRRYKGILDQWMEVGKPYLRQDFRVAEVHEKLQVNRLLCNELFDRVYNCYFRQWVLQYRIQYAVELMQTHPDMQIKEISYMSGFSSQSVFARSFAQEKGMSCTQYKDSLVKNIVR